MYIEGVMMFKQEGTGFTVWMLQIGHLQTSTAFFLKTPQS